MAQAFDVQNNNAEVAVVDANGNAQYDGSVTLGKPSYVPIPPSGAVTLYSDGTALTMYDVNGKVTTVSNGGGAVFPTTAVGASIQSLVAWNYDSEIAGTEFQVVGGTVYLHKIIIPVASTITNIVLGVTTAGNTLTYARAALYNSAGTQVGITASQTTNWASSGAQVMALTTPYSAAPGTYWVGTLTTGTTQPKFAVSPGFRAAYEAGVSGATLRHGSNATSQASLPATVTLASNTSTSDSMWVGLS